MFSTSEEKRLESLQEQWVEPGLLDALLGIDRFWTRMQNVIEPWVARHLPNPSAVVEGLGIDRYAVEGFLQHEHLLPPRHAAVRLGMTMRSFQDVVRRVEEANPWIVVPRLYEDVELFPEELPERIRDVIPGLQQRTFSAHSEFVAELHDALSAELQVDIEALRDPTSVRLGDDPVEFANQFDSITDEPMGSRYAIWLETNKPLSLRPDACSLLTFARGEELLGGLVLGRRPDDDLLDKIRDVD